MIIGKELFIDGLNEGTITHYHEGQDIEKLFFRIETIKSGSISCYFYISDFVSAKVTDKKVIVKTYITRWQHENWRL